MKWQFRSQDERIKLIRLYPTLDNLRDIGIVTCFSYGKFPIKNINLEHWIDSSILLRYPIIMKIDRFLSS